MKVFLSITLFALLSFSSTSLTGQVPTPSPTQTPLTESSKKVTESHREALSVIAANHVTGSRLNLDSITTKSIKSMLRLLDPHSVYFDSREAAQYRASLNAQYFGIGASTRELRDRRSNVITQFVRFPVKDSPAHRAGLRYGDKIVEVDGISMAGKTTLENRDSLRGPRGTSVKLVVERAGRRLSFDITRAAIPQPSIPDAYVIRPKVGYIAITQNIPADLSDELRRNFASLKAAGIEFLILDFRNNRGGLMSQACRVVMEFIPNGELIFEIVGRRKDLSFFCASDKTPIDIPIVVLTNHYTLSAGEFIAAGLQDADRALIVGETTFGKGLVQGAYELKGETRLNLTTTRFVTGIGRSTQRHFSPEDYNKYVSQGTGGELVDPVDTPLRKAYRTPTQRIMYGGGGVTPDEIVKPDAFPEQDSNIQIRSFNSTLAFAIELTAGKIKQFEMVGPVDHDHVLRGDEFVVSDELFQAFKQFALENYGVQDKDAEQFRRQIAQSLRFELVTAAYGPRQSDRIAREYDPQIQKALEVLPRARELWQKSKAVRAAKAKK